MTAEDSSKQGGRGTAAERGSQHPRPSAVCVPRQVQALPQEPPPHVGPPQNLRM